MMGKKRDSLASAGGEGGVDKADVRAEQRRQDEITNDTGKNQKASGISKLTYSSHLWLLTVETKNNDQPLSSERKLVHGIPFLKSFLTSVFLQTQMGILHFCHSRLRLSCTCWTAYGSYCTFSPLTILTALS